MNKKTLLLAAVATAVLAGAAGAAQPLQSVEFVRQARLGIDADGKITSLAFINWEAKNDLVGKRLEPIIRGWTFEPGTVDGRPVPTETTLTLSLEMSKLADDQYAIKLLSADTGLSFASMTSPAYPKRQLAALQEAWLSLIISVDQAGVPNQIVVERAITNGATKQDEKAFTEAAFKAAQQWRFQPEVVGGHSVASRVRVPVEFCVEGSSWCGQLARQSAHKGEYFQPNTPLALDSRVKLKDQVAGTEF